MATVRLGRYEAEDGDMPEVCMRCGHPAALNKPRHFSWFPWWVWVLMVTGCWPFIILGIVLAVFLTKRISCYILLCENPKSHFQIRTRLIWGLFLGLIVLTCVDVAAALLDITSDWLKGPFCLGIVALGFLWFASIPVIRWTAIHPTKITDRSVTLARICPEFVTAVNEHRARRESEYRQEISARLRDEQTEEISDPQPQGGRLPQPDECEEHG
jgi:hypothetical protein